MTLHGANHIQREKAKKSFSIFLKHLEKLKSSFQDMLPHFLVVL